MTHFTALKLTAALALALATPALAAASDFVGTWTNTDTGTRGITRIVVTPNGDGTLNMQVFGKCSPSDCDWGKVAAVAYSSGVQDTNPTVVSAVYPKGFSSTIVVLQKNSFGMVEAMNLTQFLDKSGRANYGAIDLFHR
ncbi:hypothetical protein [Deinococcus sp.]|uniref:hypothetical protein n=1 Tax=Deinococcus sp. TaxID=47478 RepID=UPI003CC6B85F